MNFRSGILVFIFLFLYSHSFADKLEKGFERLRVFDYFAAKEYFEKTLEDEPAAAAFGLGAIYSSEKNPFYNTDSARKYILISDSTYNLLKEKTKKSYGELGVTETSIDSLSEFICVDAFNNAKEKDASADYNHYLEFFYSCAQHDEVITLRNAAAFAEARTKNNSLAYKEFMSLYPQSSQYGQAKSKYDELLFEESTTENSIESYEKFLVDYPESPYRPQAEKMIYSLTVPDKTISQYVTYARKYIGGKFAKEAWQEIYKLAMKDYTIESFNNFKTAYPDYPSPEELERDFILQNYFFLPIEEEDKWGYINDLGDKMIDPAYDEASLFSEGLAVVSKHGKFGFINKAGKPVIDLLYEDAEPFHNGAAVVRKDSLYGLIDKEGNFLLKPEYEELTEASDNLFMAVRNDASAYIRKNGIALTGFDFDMAGDFKKGYAIVNKNEKYGLLNGGGSFNIEPVYSELVFITDNRLKALNDDQRWGIVNVQGDTALAFEYDAIGEYSQNLALVAKDGKCGFVNKLGMIVIPLKFIYSSLLFTTGQFQDGYALLKQKYKSTIIDTTGKALTFGGYEDYGRPSEGLIPVKKNKKWGYADMNKKLHIQCKFEEAQPFKDRFAIIRMNKMAGMIDTTGNFFIEPMYENITVMDRAIMIRGNGKWGLFSRGGILFIPCIYDKIEFLTPAIARATNADGFTYVNLESGKIIYNSAAK